MKITEEGIAFDSTGRSIEAPSLHICGGVIGINSDSVAYYGYDGRLIDEAMLTAAESIELADAMIALWTRYRQDAEEDDRECFPSSRP